VEAPVLGSFAGAIDLLEMEMIAVMTSGGVAGVDGTSRRWQRPSL
jgi:hypothetical protein